MIDQIKNNINSLNNANSNKTNVESNKGMFIKINNFLLVNLSIKRPDPNKVITDNIE